MVRLIKDFFDMKLFRKLKCWFIRLGRFITWHKYPEKPQLISILEFIVYMAIFIACFAIYVNWNKIPERRIYLEVEDLSTEKKHDVNLELKFNHSQALNPPDFEHGKDIDAGLLGQFYVPRKSEREASTYINVHCSNTVEEIQRTKNSFYKIMESQGYMVNDEHLFYIAIGNELDKLIGNEKIELVQPPQSSLAYVWRDQSSVTAWGRFHFNCISQIMSVESPLHGACPGVGITGDSYLLGNPKWWWSSDISQSYYHIVLHSETMPCSQINLNIDFLGATDFSMMDPSPDAIGMSSITFTDPDKIYQILCYGIKFHATFPEMQNKQMIRVFALTGVLGFIITIFFSFTINIIGYWLNKNKSKRK